MTAIAIADNESRLSENIVLFCRTLRRAGLAIGPGQVIDAGLAVLQSGIERRDDLFYALRSVLVTDPAQFILFEQTFRVYFRNPRLLERALGILLPNLQQATENGSDAEIVRRLIEALAGEYASDEAPDEDKVIIDIDRSESYSRREMFRHKDFEQMTRQEHREAKRLLQSEIDIIKDVPTRRFQADRVGDRYDLRKSMQIMLRNNGQLTQLARRKRRLRPPTMVLICDISGSMSRYSRVFLQFAHALASRRQTVHSFVFGTRLTNISRRLENRDIDQAVEEVSREVRDWDGGTRIADSLETFNVRWGRRLLTRRSVVLLLTDGLERDSANDLEFQMQRLKRSCDRLIWMNPMLRYEKFEPKASGIRKMLPHVDLFLPAHNVTSLLQLGQILGQKQRSTS